MAAPGADRRHPRPDLLLLHVERMAKAIGADYVARSAAFVQREFPASAPELVPKLRELYRATRRK